MASIDKYNGTYTLQVDNPNNLSYTIIRNAEDDLIILPQNALYSNY